VNHQPADKFANLRKRAEQILTEQAEALNGTPAEELAYVLHELQVHQIELEIQNEELRRTQLKREVLHRNYLELYDFAPVGYFTLDQAGRIVEANLTCATLLGVDRIQLIKQPFSQFVFADDQDAYYFFKKQLFEAPSTQSCELRLNIQLDPPIYVKFSRPQRIGAV
jgi:PAS domain-containing protein